VSLPAKDSAICKTIPTAPITLKAALLTGGRDKPYMFGLSTALVSSGVSIEVIGSDEVDSPEMHTTPNLRFLKLLGSKRPGASLAHKIWRVLGSYVRVIRYAAAAEPKIFHILWNNAFPLFDRTLLMLYYRLCGRKIVLTAHNVNAGKRDANDGLLNRLTLRIQYLLSDHIFVHTQKMKQELLQNFGVRDQVVTVIPFGINNSVPDTDLSSAEAKYRLGILKGERTVLFFGNIGPYKGLEILVAAFHKIAARHADYRLIIAGKVRGGGESYLREIQSAINCDASRERIFQRIEYISDMETELYFKAADVLVLPYLEVSQSGVLFLGYNFGLPVVAADVGSLREDIIEGKTGFLCRPGDPADLARAIEKYFASGLYRSLATHRTQIREHCKGTHSWSIVGESTRNVYAELSGTTHHGSVSIKPRSRVPRAEMDR
jgi:glycosyltransferase involved in cell wall biosynthesis